MSRRVSSGAPAPLPFFDLPSPRVLAHRGLAVEAPENTMLAFVTALSRGASYLELDVHASSDGVAVVSHDPDLTRVAGREGSVGDLTMDQLRSIDLGSGQNFCSLAEVLDAFADARLNIDIKAASAVQPTVDAILEAGASDRVLVTSFSERRRAAAVKQLPGVATSASAPVFVAALIAAKLGLSPVARRLLRDIDALQVPETASGIRVTTPRIIRRFHSAGVEIHVWTVNERADMARLLALGVDGIITDRADTALQLIDELYPA